jgi:integrase
MNGIYRRGRVFWFVYRKNGVRKFVSLKTINEFEAVTLALGILDSVRRIESFPAQSDLTNFLEYRHPRISANFHRDTSLVLLAWLKESRINTVSEITTAKLQIWFDHKCQLVKVSTAAKYLTWVRVFLNWCIDQHLRNDNPATEVKMPRFHKPFRKVFVSKKTVKMLLDECQDPELKYCLFAGFHAGLRFNEVVMSRPEWFDLTEGLLHVTRSQEWFTKDDEDRTIPLTDDFAAFLRVYGLRVPYMIGCHKKKGKRYRYTFRKRFEHYVHSKGVLITFHDCRRTFASLHASAGTSIYKISKWLGDGVQVVEKHYGHLTPKDEQINAAFG